MPKSFDAGEKLECPVVRYPVTTCHKFNGRQMRAHDKTTCPMRQLILDRSFWAIRLVKRSRYLKIKDLEVLRSDDPMDRCRSLMKADLRRMGSSVMSMEKGQWQCNKWKLPCLQPHLHLGVMCSNT
jgi:hypothetical protein